MPDADPQIKASVDERHIASDGTYQAHRFYMAMKYCLRRRIALDVGAHVGMWTKLMAERFVRVEAFEPWPVYAACFRKNVQCGNVRLHEVAVGDYRKTARLRAGPKTGVCISTRKESDVRMAVSMIRIDDLDLRDVDFLKIDVDGYELPVLRGAMELLRRCRPTVLVEQKLPCVRYYGFRDREAIELLKGLGAAVCWKDEPDYLVVWP